MIEATIRLPPICPWMNILSERVKTMRFVSCRPVFEGSGSSAVVMFDMDGSPSELAAHVKRCSNVVGCSLVKLGKRTGVGMVVSSRCPCRELGLSENHILEIAFTGSFLVMRLLLPDKRELNYILDRLRRGNVGFRVIRAGRPRTPETLTSRQEAALVHAYLGGYFNYPRPKPLVKLARELGLSPSSYSETLRRGIKKAVMRLLSVEAAGRLSRSESLSGH
ncbi:MAG: helix-turn-helix domain-containing protein [Nitrososphaerota archaeon]